MKTTPIVSHTLQNAGVNNLYRNESSGIYYAVFKRDSKQIRRSLKTKDAKTAKRKLGDLRKKVERLSTDSAAKLPFAEYQRDEATGLFTKELVGGLARRWLDSHTATSKKFGAHSRARRLRTIHMLAPHFKGQSVGSITTQDVENWALKRAKECGPRTFNMELETLNLCFQFAAAKGMVLDNPAAQIAHRAISTPSLTIPSRQQFKELVATMRQCRTMTKGCDESASAANLVEFLAYSGCRLAEAVGDPLVGKAPLTWGGINFDLRVFTVTGKGADQGKTRTVPLFPPLERLLVAMRDKLPAPPKPTDPIFAILSAKKAIQTACRRLGLPKYHHHTFRHFFASNAIEQGIDFKVIAEWLGHADGGVLVARTYGHLRAEHSTAMARRMTFDVTAGEPANVVPFKPAVNG